MVDRSRWAAELGNTVGPNALEGPHLRKLAQDLSRDLSQYINLTATLDGIFFDDGLFVGPDTTRLFERVLALQNAKHDVLTTIVIKIRDGKSHGEIFKDVEALTKSPKVKWGKNSTYIDYYNRHKSDFAEDLLSMKTSSGSDKTLKFFLQTVDKEWPKLRRAHPEPGNE